MASKATTAAFLAKAIKHRGRDCLLWPFGKSEGYGRIGRGYVHRLVCEATHGPAPTPRHYAVHSCDTPACINPKHLRWGTPADNAADAIDHGGNRHPNAKLNVKQVRRILTRSNRSNAALATEYQVCTATIAHIRNKRNWSWIDE